MKRFFLVSFVNIIVINVNITAQVNFTGPELLGRPTDQSVTLNVYANTNIEAYVEYGTVSGNYTNQTSIIVSIANEPFEIVITGLSNNTRYYYRLRYSTNGGISWINRDEHSFHTQRERGTTFTFTIIADSHMNGGLGNVSLYEQTLDRVKNDNPDFHFDLGDTFWTDGVADTTIANQRFLAQRMWMGVISHSSPIFLAPGNHENEEGWNFDDANSIALLSVNARKRYYLNPVTDSFYSGNDDALPEIGGDHLREDYFAWEWGDALFVVIDPFQYTMTKPYSGTAGGEVNDESPIGDRWDWTLGYTQFQWLKQTLEQSDAKFKFVFAHHMVGGTHDYVRGGAEPADLFEWGGYNADINNNATTWGFSTERPGWGDVPIHQFMVASGTSAFFYGHDHEYAYQKRDGVVYQLVPSPSMTGYGFNLYSESDPYTIRVLPNSGYLRITVSPVQATVEYVKTSDGTIAHSYTIDPTEPSSQPPNQPAIVQPPNEATDISTSPTLEVTVSDPDEDDLTVTFYGQSAETITVGEDFTIILLPDTQNESQFFPTIFSSQTQWIVDNKTTKNIVFVTHQGDIVNNANSDIEWMNADASMDLLDGVGIPYSVGPGNHDLPIYSSPSYFNTYFGIDRFHDKSWYGGYYGSDNYNNFSLFSASGINFILINLQYNPTIAILDWADARLKEYSDRRGIVVSHNILNIDNSWSNQGIYTALKDNPNLFLMLCGHMHTSTDGAAQRTETGDNGNTIYILMSDYQDYPNGGNGYLRIMRFSPSNNKIYVQTYSPYISAYLTDTQNQFELNYNMESSTSFENLGIISVIPSGENASIMWPNLDTDKVYNWYVEVSDGNNVIIGPTWSFTTESTSISELLVKIKIFLEGSYTGSEGMNTELNSVIPTSDPYSQGDTVSSIPSDAVDWVFVELRSDDTTVVDVRAAFIKDDGNIVDLDGTSPVKFNGIAGEYYIVIKHRNHLGVMSASMVTVPNSTAYDFTTGSGQYYRGSTGAKDLGSGVWGMIAGDGNGNGQVQNNDSEDIWKPDNGNSGYRNSDFNMNGQVQNNDNEDYWKPNNGRGSQVPAMSESLAKPLLEKISRRDRKKWLPF
jgi:hypothetical protein